MLAAKAELIDQQFEEEQEQAFLVGDFEGAEMAAEGVVAVVDEGLGEVEETAHAGPAVDAAGVVAGGIEVVADFEHVAGVAVDLGAVDVVGFDGFVGVAESVKPVAAEDAGIAPVGHEVDLVAREPAV